MCTIFYSEAELDDLSKEENTGADGYEPMLPPGMSMDRLPANIKAFVMQHYQPAGTAIRNPNGSQEGKERQKCKLIKETKKTAKHVPRPPPGPPPASAVVK
jgi:hypothetical protein